MSISSEITNLTTMLTNVYTEIENKEVVISTNKNFDNLATNISNIKLGIPLFKTDELVSLIPDGDLRDIDQLWEGSDYVSLTKNPKGVTYTMLVAGEGSNVYLAQQNALSFNLTSNHVYMIGMEFKNNVNYPDLVPGLYLMSTSDSANSYTKSFKLQAVSTSTWGAAASLFVPSVDSTCTLAIFSVDNSLGATFDIKEVFLVDLTATFGNNADFTRYAAYLLDQIKPKSFPVVRINEPTGTYATSEYYSSYAANFLNYNKAFIVIEGGTSTAYENINFVLASAPSGISIGTQTAHTYASTTAGTAYICILDGVQNDITIDLSFDAINATSDYVTCNITITEGEE